MGKATPHLKTISKTLLGIILLFYVFNSKMVDFASLKLILYNPTHLLVAFSFLSFSILCCCLRWFLIIRIQKLSQSFPSIISLTLIGNFFNTFMPGSVGGDLIKAWYIAGREPEKRTRAVFSVLIDRVLGLGVIVCYSAVTLLFFTQWLKGNSQLQITAVVVWIFSSSCLLFSLCFFWPSFWRFSIVNKGLALLHKKRRIGEITDSIMTFKDQFPTVAASILLSIFSVLGTILFNIYLGNLLNINLTYAQYFFIIPLALTASAIPLLPGGLGTGQVAFFTLFKWMGAPNPELGATLCTLLQVYTILFNCSGAICYLKSKRKGTPTSSKETFSNFSSPTPCL